MSDHDERGFVVIDKRSSSGTQDPAEREGMGPVRKGRRLARPRHRANAFSK